MFRRMTALLFAALMVGVLAPNASATHTIHEPIPGNKADFVPQPDGVCDVQGTVTTSPGVSATPTHGHYDFVTASITCTAVNPLSTLPTGAYDVDANGATDGEGTGDAKPGDETYHGETDAIGWSHSGEYVASGNACDDKKNDSNKGNITATHEDSQKTLTGWVKFIRVGSAVEAWGCLAWDNESKGKINFQAELQFIPNPPDQNPVTNAILLGAAVVGPQT